MSGTNSPVNVVAANGTGVILDANLNAMAQTCATVAVLRGFIGITGMAVVLQGVTAAGDGGAGIFYWASGSYTDDGVTVIVPSGATGQGAWLRSSSLYVPKYTVSALPNEAQGAVAYATNGRNPGESASAGTGCLVTVNSAMVWTAVWSGVAVTV